MIKSGRIKPGELLPPVFPLVLYNGAKGKTARTNIAELIVPTTPMLAKYCPSQRYFLVDESQVPKEMLQDDSPAAHLIRMERSGAPEDLREAIKSFRVRFSGPQYSSPRDKGTLLTNARRSNELLK